MKKFTDKILRKRQSATAGASGNPPAPDLQPNLETEHHHRSPRESPPATFPDGVKLLHDCPDAIVDICFVHGLTGDRDRTWTAHGQSQPWPKTLLPPELHNARILSYGYNAYIVRTPVPSSNRLLDHATNLLHDLTTYRERHNTSSRPLIFVAHSLGGLVCKEAILLSQISPHDHLRNIFDYVKGIIFMGTPHGGSWMAIWARISASAIGLAWPTNKSLVEVLEIKNQFLESIQVRFLAMVREQRENGRSLEITCFYEELPLPGVGIVVPKESATFEGYNPMSIHANHRDMARFVSVEDNGFQRLLGELRRWRDQIENEEQANDDELVSECLKSLAFPEMNNRSNDINPATEGTCQWLLQDPVYEQWKTGDRGLLWIKGKPGSGKSTLLRYALKNTTEPESKCTGLVLSFFFHGRGAELQRTPSGLFRSLLHQILSQVPGALRRVVATFEERCKNMGEPNKMWVWHPHELKSFLKASLLEVLRSRSIKLFIDALDESGQENAVSLVSEFKLLLRELPLTSSRFHICFSCRHYPILALDYGLQICVEDRNWKDISTYVHAQFSAVGSKAPVAMRDTIARSASGIFMWARLVTEKVIYLELSGTGWNAIATRIDTVPADLGTLYLDLVRGVDEAEIAPSLKLISWICFAERPLTLDELRWAMVVDADHPQQSLQECLEAEGYISDNDLMERRMQALTGGLVEVTPPGHGAGRAQFIHQSVKDFFVNEGLAFLHGLRMSADVVATRAHLRLSIICSHYLAMEEISRSKSTSRDVLISEFPFLAYTTHSLVTHLRKSDSRDANQEGLLMPSMWPSRDIAELWGRMFREVSAHYEDAVGEGTTLVHVTSRYGLLEPLKAILGAADQVAAVVDSKDGLGRTPLMWAAGKGQVAVVKALLDTEEVETESKDIFGETALSWAAGSGHGAVVEYLLARDGVDSNSKDVMGRTPLQWAARNGHEDVVKLLLETGTVDARAKSWTGRTPLLWAAMGGHEAVVRMLLDTGEAEVDAKDAWGGTPLLEAMEGGHEAIVKMLLDTGKTEKDVTPRMVVGRGNGVTRQVD